MRGSYQKGKHIGLGGDSADCHQEEYFATECKPFYVNPWCCFPEVTDKQERQNLPSGSHYLVVSPAFSGGKSRPNVEKPEHLVRYQVLACSELQSQHVI